MNEKSLFQYLFRGGVWAFSGKLIATSMSFLLSVILARTLSPSDMAIFFISNSVALFLSISGRFGLDNTLLRLISKSISIGDYSFAKGVLINGMILVGIISFGLAIFLYLGPAAWFLSLVFPLHQVGNVVNFILIWSVTLSFQFLFAEIFRAFREVELSVVFGGALTAILSVGLLFTMWHLNVANHILTVLSAILLAGIFNCIAGIIIITIRIKRLDVQYKSSVKYSALLQSSWPLWINAMTHYILVYAGLWILGAFGSGLEVAHYGAANRLVILAGVSLMVVNVVVPPLISGFTKKQDKHEHLERILRGTATIAAVPALVIVGILFFFPEDIMVILFGLPYKGGADFLRILLVGQSIGILSGSCGYLLMMTGNHKALMYISIIASITLLCGGLFFVHIYGALGVAWATTLTVVLQQILTVVCAYRLTGIKSYVSFRHTKQFVKKDLFRSGI